ncbi:AAA family ATPase [Mesorhizobium sp. AA22]|uniref:AAA family ATPase n=1 Tax=Mesorhizobium sp. AA22 TaxID=1854057 RepID=UPI0009F1EF5D|nr:AAA family ATPase [Mesorhizobium sp. AA22]QIA23643.1 AAA family ATPase [Mesorhizobium sp. AA22]
MRIDRFQLSNYSSFSDTGPVDLKPGINIIVGENNAGKSAILRSLYHLENTPHRSPREFRAERLGYSHLDLDVSISGDEIKSAWLKSITEINWTLASSDLPAAQRMMDEFLSSSSLNMKVEKQGNTHPILNIPFRNRPNSAESIALFKKDAGRILYIPGRFHDDNTYELVNSIWHNYVFMFDAQRFGLGRSSFGYPERLNSRADNLAAVLNRIQGERATLFAKLVDHIREIFSTIRNLSVRPTQQGDMEVLVWPVDEQLHPELSVGLNDSGTGVAQAISILTVAMTLDEAVIIIDEISSFLHPAAAKTLLRILQTNYPQHQYIVSTHSSEVLSASSPSVVHFVRKSGFESSISSVDLGNLEDLRQVTGQLGISMTDVFAVDRIIWVEGPTEELCFPYIYTQAAGPMPRSTMFVPVIATGDFSKTGTRLELVLEIYRRLGSAAAPLVTSVTFGFDSEDLSQREKEDLLRRSDGRVRLLPRRHFECYLLDPAAIAALVVAHVPDLQFDELREVINKCLISLGGDAAFKAADVFKGDIFDPQWLAKVDAAKLIKRVCSDVSSQRFAFAKKVHSLELLKVRMASDAAKEELAELIAYVTDLVDGSKERPAPDPRS